MYRLTRAFCTVNTSYIATQRQPVNAVPVRMAMDEGVWSFGYGSNMDIVALQTKKKVRVSQYAPAVLKGYKMAFTQGGPKYVEPGYGGLKKLEGAEVHGIAFCMDAESEAKLDRDEGAGKAYSKETVALRAYDGRDLEGFIYMPLKKTDEEHLPSARYLGVLCKGARQAGLDPEYISKLASHPVYRSEDHPEALQAREERNMAKSGLREVTRKELLDHKAEDTWVSCLGFVIKAEGSNWFGSHKGRDITTRTLMQFHGIPLDDNDDGGQPPYPLLANLTDEEVEYITNWLDFYHAGRSDKNAEMIGFLKEFKEQQESGMSEFVLPPVPK